MVAACKAVPDRCARARKAARASGEVYHMTCAWLGGAGRVAQPDERARGALDRRRREAAGPAPRRRRARRALRARARARGGDHVARHGGGQRGARHARGGRGRGRGGGGRERRPRQPRQPRQPRPPPAQPRQRRRLGRERRGHDAGQCHVLFLHAGPVDGDVLFTVA